MALKKEEEQEIGDYPTSRNSLDKATDLYKIRNKLNNPQNCSECEYTSECPYKLRYHYETEHSLDFCPECNIMFHYRSNLVTHMRDFHSDGNVDFNCSYLKCDFTTTCFDDFRKHKEGHKEILSCKIPSCGPYTTTHRQNFESHMISKHSETLPNTLVCNMCQKTFATEGGLVRHKRIHTGERPFACHFCDYESSDHSNLKRHIRRKHPKLDEGLQKEVDDLATQLETCKIDSESAPTAEEEEKKLPGEAHGVQHVAKKFA